jgi:hypothetical protein
MSRLGGDGGCPAVWPEQLHDDRVVSLGNDKEGTAVKHIEKKSKNPVFGLRYLEDREVEGIDIVGCGLVGLNSDILTCPDTDPAAMN